MPVPVRHHRLATDPCQDISVCWPPIPACLPSSRKPWTRRTPLAAATLIQAMLGYGRQWLAYSWYAVGLAFVTACWVTGDRYLRRAMVPPQEAWSIWRALKPRWRT